MNLEEIHLYRMTHINNIHHILKYGITHRSSRNNNPNFVGIGDISLINTRDNKHVAIDNGNFSELNSPTIRLGDFIPFYFGVKMPMLYVIQNGGNFVGQPTPPAKIVYMACSITNVVKQCDMYYFCDGHATDHLTTFYDRTRIAELPTIIDWNAIKAPYWAGQDNLNIKRKKQAEFLAFEDIAPQLIVRFGCYNETAKNELLDYGINEEKIKVIPNAYY